jgi:hypothetical protein
MPVLYFNLKVQQKGDHKRSSAIDSSTSYWRFDDSASDTSSGSNFSKSQSLEKEGEPGESEGEGEEGDGELPYHTIIIDCGLHTPWESQCWNRYMYAYAQNLRNDSLNQSVQAYQVQYM